MSVISSDPQNKDWADISTHQEPCRVYLAIRRHSSHDKILQDESCSVRDRWDKIVAAACKTLGVDVRSAKLMLVRKSTQQTQFLFELWHDRYDWTKAHDAVVLPVVCLRYKRRGPSVCMIPKYMVRAADEVARMHAVHSWDDYPPYFVDESSQRPGPPCYDRPRAAMPSPSGVPDQRRFVQAVWIPSAAEATPARPPIDN